MKDPYAVEACMKELEIPLIENALFDQLILTICFESQEGVNFDFEILEEYLQTNFYSHLS